MGIHEEGLEVYQIRLEEKEEKLDADFRIVVAREPQLETVFYDLVDSKLEHNYKETEFQHKVKSDFNNKGQLAFRPMHLDGFSDESNHSRNASLSTNTSSSVTSTSETGNGDKLESYGVNARDFGSASGHGVGLSHSSGLPAADMYNVLNRPTSEWNDTGWEAALSDGNLTPAIQGTPHQYNKIFGKNPLAVVGESQSEDELKTPTSPTPSFRTQIHHEGMVTYDWDTINRYLVSIMDPNSVAGHKSTELPKAKKHLGLRQRLRGVLRRFIGNMKLRVVRLEENESRGYGTESDAINFAFF